MEYLRFAFAANLNRAADTLDRLAGRVSADYFKQDLLEQMQAQVEPGATIWRRVKQDAIEEMQAQVEAGAAIWGAVIAGFITVPEIVEEVEGFAGNGLTEPDTTLDNGVHCANLFFGVMREFVYPLGEAVAPHYALLNEEHWEPSEDESRMLRQSNLKAEATGCRLLARLIETAGTRVEARTANEERDAWLYHKCCELVAYDDIIRQLATLAKEKGWELIGTVQGVKAAAARYAKNHARPPIPSRQPGRQKSERG